MLDTLGNLERTHTCGELRESNVGEQVVLMGWVAKKRDFGFYIYRSSRPRRNYSGRMSSEAHRGLTQKAKNIRGDSSLPSWASSFRGRGLRQSQTRDGDIEIKVNELLVLNDATVRRSA